MPSNEIQGKIQLRSGREKRTLRGHPWILKADIELVEGEPQPGSLVQVVSATKSPIGIATYYAPSFAPGRMLSLGGKKIDREFFAQKLESAWDARSRIFEQTNAVRACFSEADGLPGLVVDSFDGHAVVQVRTLGMDNLRHLWLPEVERICGQNSVFERSDYSGRNLEGMEPSAGPLTENCPPSASIQEGPIQMKVPIADGLKTGHYLDQRAARLILGQLVKPDESMLDLFCYTGGFALHAAMAGAKCLGIDSNEEAIGVARENAFINRLDPKFEVDNCFTFLEAHEEQYDWIVVDPPAIAKHRGQKNSLKHAVYKLMRLAAPRLKPGGTIVICSCSHQISLEEMLATSQDAAGDEGLNFALERITLQDTDHPAPMGFPEALYLKCVWLRRLG